MSNLGKQQTNANYMWIKKEKSATCSNPKAVEDLIKKDKMTKVLKNPLSPRASSTANSGPPRSSASSKVTVPPAMPNLGKHKRNANHIGTTKGKSLVCVIPPALEDVMEIYKVPEILINPLSHETFESSKPSTSSSVSPQASASFEPTVSPAVPNLTKQHTNANRIWVEKNKSPTYVISEATEDLIEKDKVHESVISSSSPKALESSDSTTFDSWPPKVKTKFMWTRKKKAIYGIPRAIKILIKQDKVPGVLRCPLSPSNYEDHFAALLYAEDFHIEKWSQFKLLNVNLKLKRAAVNKNSTQNTNLHGSGTKDYKTFVTFEIAKAPEKRPFLLSRDFVFVRPSGSKLEPYQGILHKVKKGTHVFVEFGEDFLYQHHSTRAYDVSFSFNRICLKRAHQAIRATSDPLFRSFIFPDCDSRESTTTLFSVHTYWCNRKLDLDQKAAVTHILSSQGQPPYLVEGPLSVSRGKNDESNSKQPSRTGSVVREAVFQLYRSSPEHRILICAPLNSTCDVLMQCLRTDILDSDMFRANAAFREVDGVPVDILLSCPFEGECFTCPSIQELKEFRVILSTFASSFRLHNEGIAAGHFSHIFLVDASSATEPETMITLANLASENTAVIVTGAPNNCSGWVRSDIARKHGLKVSYFERIRESMPYQGLDPQFITKLS